MPDDLRFFEPFPACKRNLRPCTRKLYGTMTRATLHCSECCTTWIKIDSNDWNQITITPIVPAPKHPN